MEKELIPQKLTINDLAAPAPLVFRKKKTMTYKYPKIDTVEPGGYFSAIKSVESSVTRKGENAFDVCYIIVNYIQYAQYLLGLTEIKPKCYRIKERIVRNSERELNFIDSLSECYELDENFVADDIIGLTEFYKISYYGDDDCIGTIKDRRGYTEEELMNWYNDNYLQDI